MARVLKIYLFFAVVVFSIHVNAVEVMKFSPGQEWSYKTRLNEPNSTFIVLKVDGDIIHIALINLKIRDLQSVKGYSNEISHLPIYRSALIKSSLRQVGEVDVLPEYDRGYKKWKKAYLDKQSVPFSLSIDDALNYIEKAINLK